MNILRPQRLLVPYDFSEHADRALRVARGLGAHEVHVVHVVQAADALAWAGGDDRRRTEEGLDALKTALAGTGLETAHRHVLHGDPARQIAELAVSIAVELIVIASHGRTGWDRVALGSVAERVVRYARCPVLVLRE